MRFIIIENTPGYLPEQDDPPEFDRYSEAVECLNSLAKEYEEDGYLVQYGVASSSNLAAVIVTVPDRVRDLERWIAIERGDHA